MRRPGRIAIIKEHLDGPPPRDLEAERAVLGSIILDRSVLDGLDLEARDFHTDAGRKLFEHLGNLPGTGPVDAVLLKDWLKGAGDWEAIGGAAFIAEVSQSVPYIHNVAHYARLVKCAAVKRQIILRCLDGARFAYNGQDDPAALVQEITAGLESVGIEAEERFKGITAAEMYNKKYPTNFLVEDLLVEGQPMILAGPIKSLKTSLLLDLAVSLADSKPVFGRFRVPEPVRTGFISLESGDATIKETWIRIAKAKGSDPEKIENLIFREGTEPLKFANAKHMRGLEHFIRNNALKAVVVDPAYLVMPATDANSAMAQGGVLGDVSALCAKLGCNFILAHHFTKTLARVTPKDPYPLPELRDLAWAGYAEHFRQWILVARSERYEAGSGTHRLWLSVGGSAGHSGEWALEANEGDREWTKVNGRRKWEISVSTIPEIRDAAKKRQQDAKVEEKLAALETDAEKILATLAKPELANGETERQLMRLSGVWDTRFKNAISHAYQQGYVESCEIVKGNRKKPFPGWKLPNTDNTDAP